MCAAGLVAVAAIAIARLEELWQEVVRLAATRLVTAGDRVRSGGQRLARSSVGGLDAGDRLLVDAARRVQRGSDRALSLAEQRLVGAEARRRSFDPALALARGWSITRDGDGRVIRSVADAA